jgi:hypothetical protein
MPASELAAGSMSAADKTKIDGLTCDTNFTTNVGQFSCADNEGIVDACTFAGFLP